MVTGQIDTCINFLIADVIKFVCGTIITFSQWDVTKPNLSSSQSMAAGISRDS